MKFGAVLLGTIVALACSRFATEGSQAEGPAVSPILKTASASLFERSHTINDGLGPAVNAQGCVGCHARPSTGGAARSSAEHVIVSPEERDPSGGQVFRRFLIDSSGRTRVQPLPRQLAYRRPPPLYGLGLLEAAERTAAPTSALPRGRLGWKGRFQTVDEAVKAAFANELGLLVAEFSGNSAPEISAVQIREVSDFVRSLPPLPPKTVDTAGAAVFASVGCAACHTPSLTTGDSPVPTLRRQTIAPYTDLKLHDMGPALSDGWDADGVKGSAFRTPPLWGLGTIGPPFLHDGRAETVEQAILLHGGEAEASTQMFRRLAPAEQKRLIAFVSSR